MPQPVSDSDGNPTGCGSFVSHLSLPAIPVAPQGLYV